MVRQRKGLIIALLVLVAVAFTILSCSTTSTSSQSPIPTSPESIIAAVSPTLPPVPKLMFLTDTSKPKLTILAPTGDYEFESRMNLKIDLDAIPPPEVKTELAASIPLYSVGTKHSLSSCMKVYNWRASYSEPTIVEEATSLYERTLPPHLATSPDITICGYKDDEPPAVSLINPFGDVMLKATATGISTCYIPGSDLPDCYQIDEIGQFDFLPGDLLGKYTIEIVSKEARLVHTFDLLDLTAPTIYYSNRLENYVAAGFNPSEEVRVLAYSKQGKLTGEGRFALDDSGVGLLIDGDQESVIVMVRENLDFVVSHPGSVQKIGDRIAALAETIEHNPGYLPALYERARLYEMQHSYTEAVIDYSRVIGERYAFGTSCRRVSCGQPSNCPRKMRAIGMWLIS